MKKIIFIITLLTFVFACGSNDTSNNDNAPKIVTWEEIDCEYIKERVLDDPFFPTLDGTGFEVKNINFIKRIAKTNERIVCSAIYETNHSQISQEHLGNTGEFYMYSDDRIIEIRKIEVIKK